MREPAVSVLRDVFSMSFSAADWFFLFCIFRLHSIQTVFCGCWAGKDFCVQPVRDGGYIGWGLLYTTHSLSRPPVVLSLSWLGVLENEGRWPTGRFKWAFLSFCNSRPTTTTPWEFQKENFQSSHSESFPFPVEWIILFYQLWRTMGYVFFLTLSRFLRFP